MLIPTPFSCTFKVETAPYFSILSLIRSYLLILRIHASIITFLCLILLTSGSTLATPSTAAPPTMAAASALISVYILIANILHEMDLLALTVVFISAFHAKLTYLVTLVRGSYDIWLIAHLLLINNY